MKGRSDDLQPAEVKDPWTLVSPRRKIMARPTETGVKSAPATTAARAAPVAIAELVDPVEATVIPTADITNEICGFHINIINNNNNNDN